MEITDGVAKISASYSLKLPHQDVQYASESPYLSVTLEVPVEGEIDNIKDRLLDIEADLMTEVKLAVFAQLDVEPKELPSGVLAPDLSKFASAGKGKSTGRQGNRSASGRGGKSTSRGNTSRRGTGARRGSNGSSRGVDKSDLPRVELEFWNKFEEEMQTGTFVDQRSLKEDGTYKAGAADFVQVEGGSYQLWINDKDGSLNEDTAEALDAAGIDY